MKNTYKVLIKGNDVFDYECGIEAESFNELASKIRIKLSSLSKVTIERLAVVRIQICSLCVFND